MENPSLSTSTIAHFKENLQGELLLPEDARYHEARCVWNGMIDRFPAMIVQCADANDVIAAVKFARENEMLISVKGGGHGVAGKAVCNDGLMLDMYGMNVVSVDTTALVATVGPGATLGELDKETLKHGLVTTSGIFSTTGVAGLTLGGGIGYLARKYGLTLDNLLSVDVVTAEGELLHCNKNENSNLFWALRGGGGNFGVVVSFQFQLHKQNPEVLTAQLFYPMENGPQMLQKYRELMAEAPDDLGAYAYVVNIPPADPFPQELQGSPAFFILACYAGDHKEGRKLLEPLQEIGNPILAVIDAMPYTALQQSFDGGAPKGKRYYWKSLYFKELSEDAIQTFFNYARDMKGPLSILGFEPMGGAIARVAPEDTAFVGRDANFSFGIWLGWNDPDEDQEMIAWARNFYQAMAPFASEGVYSNYLDQDDDGQILEAYGRNFNRLQSIKRQYDPDNFFSHNFNIIPKA